MKEVKILKFAKDFKKLDKFGFSTIRLSDKGIEVNEPVYIQTPTKEFRAILVQKEIRQLKLIGDAFLCQDTDTLNPSDARNVLKEFYPDITESTELTILFFKRDGDYYEF